MSGGAGPVRERLDDDDGLPGGADVDGALLFHVTEPVVAADGVLVGAGRRVDVPSG